jgi:hypothetical protein
LLKSALGFFLPKPHCSFPVFHFRAPWFFPATAGRDFGSPPRQICCTRVARSDFFRKRRLVPDFHLSRVRVGLSRSVAAFVLILLLTRCGTAPPLDRVLVLPLLLSFSRVRRLVASGSAGEICLPDRLWKTSSSVGGVPSNPLLISPAGFPSVRVERSVVRKWPPSPKIHFALCSPIWRPRELSNLC